MGSVTSAEEYDYHRFSDMDYGSMNHTPPDYYTDIENSTSNVTYVLEAPVGYSTLHIIIASIILTFMMIVVVIGNMLVIIAIATEKTLKNIQNWFIASLAVADFFVGLMIMPFSLANELMGYWIFGKIWCSIHSALDVLLCTSSIMNICLISLDRYWSITQAVDYLKKRTPARAAVMIAMVWILSALISIPPLLGWRDQNSDDTPPKLPTCELSKKIGYVLYSAMGSFYIPSCIMVFVYIRIYYAARDRARRAVRKPPRPKPVASAMDLEDNTSRVATTNFSASARSSSSPRGPQMSIESQVVTSPVELNPVPGGVASSDGNCSAATTPVTEQGRTVKQVGFQEPLVSHKSSSCEITISKPEITVEGCSPEDSVDENNGSSKEEKIVQVTVEDVRESETERSSNGGGDVRSNNKSSTSLIETRISTGSQQEQQERTTDNTPMTTTATSTCEGKNEEEDKDENDEVYEDGEGNTEAGSSINNNKTNKENNASENSSHAVQVQSSPNGCGSTTANNSSLALKSNNQAKGSSRHCIKSTISDTVERVSHHSTLAVSELENTITELHTNGSNRPDEICSSTTISMTTTTKGAGKGSKNRVPSDSQRAAKRPKLHFLRVETPTIWRTSSSLSLNGDVHILGTLSRSCSRLHLEADPVSDVEPSSSDSGAISRCAVVKPLKLRLCQPFFGKKFGSSSASSSSSAKARRDVLDIGKLNSPKEIRDPEREKRRIARKKEKRATLILGLIMGSFILCWLPFFFLYIFEPLCNCTVAPWGFAIAFWLGYLNSALNPVIYTIFNKDFRRAFRRILFK